MKTLWMGMAASLAVSLAAAQATIYKHVDEAGRVTYTNRPMGGAVVVELEPISTIPGFPAKPAAVATPVPAKPEATAPAPADSPAPGARPGTPTVAVVKPRVLPIPASTPKSTPPARAAKPDERRRSLEAELAEEEASLAEVRRSLQLEQRNPALIAAVRRAQEAVEATPAEQAQMRADLEKASGRIRGLQSTAAEHERKIAAIRKAIDSL